MKTVIMRVIVALLLVCCTGVPLVFLGSWLQVAWLYRVGFILSLLLFMAVLPLCLAMLILSVTSPFWFAIASRFRKALRRGPDGQGGPAAGDQPPE